MALTDIKIGKTAVQAVLARVEQSYELGPLLECLLALNSRLPDGWPVGLERDLLLSEQPKLSLAKVALHHRLARAIRFEDRSGTDHLLRRPASELAAYRLWSVLDQGQFTATQMGNISRLAGGASQLRETRAGTTPFPSHHRLEFLEPELVVDQVLGLLNRVSDPNPSLHPILHAVGIYFETLVIHPVVDGNGRLARLLFQGSLHRTLGLKAPIYPLGPALALHREYIVTAYLAWYFDENPKPVIDFAVATLQAMNKIILSRTAESK
jgi:hypothetical protein